MHHGSGLLLIIFPFQLKSKNNKVDVEGFVALSSKMDPTKADLAREIATTCADITDADRCEAAFKGYHCLHETAIAKGISPSDM